MPTFFFDIADHKFLQRDHQGRDLVSLDAARVAAHAELRNWIGDRQADAGYWLEIRDASGTLLERMDPAPNIAVPAMPSNPSLARAESALPLPENDLLLAILALRRTLARLAALGEEDVEDSGILELLRASYAERTAAQITRAAAPQI